MFQPGTRTFDDAVALPSGGAALLLAPPRKPRLPSPAALTAAARAKLSQVDAYALADELLVDLGHAIGSRAWWRGALTCTALVAGAAWLGLRAPAFVTPVDAPAPALSEQRADGFTPLARGGRSGVEVPATALARPLAQAPERPRVEVDVSLRAVDSVGGALRRAGVGATDIKVATDLIEEAIDLRRLKPGTSFDVVLGRRETTSVPRPLESIAFRAAFDLRLELVRGGDGALALKRVPIAVDDTPLRVTGTVGSSLYQAARSAGLPARVVSEYIRQLSYVVDFQREVRGRDRFDIVIEQRRAETGEVELGGLLYAGLQNGAERIEMMRWQSGGRAQFFDATGESVRKGLMRTPVDGARMTSGFGFRIHPVLGYSRLHKGVDFGAPTGTPVMASASGTVRFAGWHGGHGNYIMINHKPALATAYGHLSRILVRPGQRVEQGQVIGHVGSTGLSTGPHLHYEVWVNGQAVDPRSTKLPTSVQLAGGELARFRSALARMRGLEVAGAAPSGEQVAQADERPRRG